MPGVPVMPGVGRNAPCPCGCGKKDKRCYIGRDDPPPPTAMDAAPAAGFDPAPLLDPLSFNPRLMERTMADLHRLVAGREFATDAEMDAFLLLGELIRLGEYADEWSAA